MITEGYYFHEHGNCKRCGKPMAVSLAGVPSCPACRAAAAKEAVQKTA